MMNWKGCEIVMCFVVVPQHVCGVPEENYEKSVWVLGHLTFIARSGVLFLLDLII